MAEKKKNKRYGLWIIVILVLVGLAGFGTSGLTSNLRSLGTVGDEEVTVAEYQRTLQDQLEQLRSQLGPQIGWEQARQFGLEQRALSQMILTATVDNEADRLGLSVGDAEVLRRLRGIPQFQGASGFNRDSYRFALESRGQTEAQFENELREDVTRSLVQGAVISGVPPIAGFADALTTYVAETRTVDWAEITEADLDATAAVPGEADLQAYYDANPAEFTAPETRRITYVALTPEMLADEIEVSEAEIEAAYEANAAEFRQPERRLVERLAYFNAEQAAAAAAEVEAGSKTFDDLVTGRGLELSDVDLGDVTQAELGAAGETVFAAEPGDVVGPVETSMGPAIFRVNAVLAAQETPLAEVEEELRYQIAVERASDEINRRTDAAVDLIAGGATLEDIAERTDLQLGTMDFTAESEEGLAAYGAFRDAAASATEGAFPELRDLSDGGIFALRLDGVTPPALRPFEEVRDEVAAAVEAEALTTALLERAEALATQLEAGSTFADLGLSPSREEGVNRRTILDGTPVGFNETLYTLNDAGEATAMAEGARAVVLQLVSTAAPDMENTTVAAQRAQFADTAAAGIAQDIFEVYAEMLRRQTEVAIDQSAVNAVNAQLR